MTEYQFNFVIGVFSFVVGTYLLAIGLAFIPWLCGILTGMCFYRALELRGK